MKALITVTGVQNLQDSGDDSIELITDGIYTKIPDGYAVKYAESELTGLSGTTTTVEIEPESVAVERKGTLNMRMEFKEGHKTSFLYDTQFGSATLCIETRKIVADFNEKGGEMCIDYVVNMEHAVVGKNKLKMSVRPR
ncbi:MAG: DUF1934 domain-containing protein [Bacillota bacterium]|nr:DUF1934 domain-containing protein [Bacillota bacterium]